jgi:hypothetical protein
MGRVTGVQRIGREVSKEKGVVAMIKKCGYSLFFMMVFYSAIASGYDDQVTHPALTLKAITPQFDQYLKSFLGFPLGKQSELLAYDKKQSIQAWLAQGSFDEDHHPCRAANHFHNPLLPWDQSQMSDDRNPLETPMAYAIAQGCAVVGWPSTFRKSNVTWATGYKSPSPDGFKYMFLSSESPLPINWDTARESYYSALTSRSTASRDTNFATTFSALGHVLHLIQDMAVPAHVRNDFQSHLFAHGWGFRDNYFNRYEYHVMNNNGMINEVTPEVPPVSNRRLTDFWDTNTYDGTNPSYRIAQGLAEFTNANFFSDFTIPFANPLIPVRPEHSFPQPGLDYYGNQYHLCNDTNVSGQIVQYLSRSTCPTSGPIDHFLTASLLNTRNGAANFFWTDDKVHRTYASELLPRAVGYSAGLLNYFFRGNVNLADPNPESTPGQYVIINKSSEDMTGTFSLYYDDSTGNRTQISLWPNMQIAGGGTSAPVSFQMPNNLKFEDSKLMLVFQGTKNNIGDVDT